MGYRGHRRQPRVPIHHRGPDDGATDRASPSDVQAGGLVLHAVFADPGHPLVGLPDCRCQHPLGAFDERAIGLVPAPRAHKVATGAGGAGGLGPDAASRPAADRFTRAVDGAHRCLQAEEAQGRQEARAGAGARGRAFFSHDRRRRRRDEHEELVLTSICDAVLGRFIGKLLGQLYETMHSELILQKRNA